MNLLSKCSRFVHLVYFHTLRAGERVFGPRILFWMILPEIVLTCLERHRDYSQLQRLRGAWPASFWKDVSAFHHFVSMFCDWTCSLTTTLFYDRLNSPAWKKRITVRGTPPHLLSDHGKRPLVIAFLHTGGFPLLRYWLRAQRVPTASHLGGLPRTFRHGQKFRDRADRIHGLSDVPHIFSGGKSLRDAVRFLQPGCALTVALEERDFQKPREEYLIDGTSICLSRLAFRVALLADAVLMPAAIRQAGPFRFEVTFGRPVPTNLMKEGSMTAANLHLLRELWPGVEADPAALTWTTLEAVAPHLIKPRGTTP